MSKYVFITMIILAAGAMQSCNETEIDDVKPLIDLSGDGAFPRNCDTLYLGETFTFRATLTDNEELGGFSIEVHQNFDHHSHSTEVTVCEYSPVKEPVNPFQYAMEYEIPAGLTTFEAEVEIEIPAADEDGAIDSGDYHFLVQLTDRVGWSVQRGMSVKVMARD